MRKGEEQYKAIGEGEGKEAIEELKNEVMAPLVRDIDKLRDPIVIASIMHSVATERENTNRLLKTLIEKLDSKFLEVERRIEALEGKESAHALEIEKEEKGVEDVLLPSVDEEIVKFVRERRFASAEDVRARFDYKGKNAASARLNRLYALGLLVKKQVGRKVLFGAKKK